MRIVFDHRVGQARYDVTTLRHECDRLVLEPAGPPQRGEQLFLDALRTLRGNEFGGTPANHFFACIAQPLHEGVVNVEVTAVLADRGRHGWRLAKQPLIVVDCGHPGSLYEIS